MAKNVLERMNEIGADAKIASSIVKQNKTTILN